jgi:hypothetical protein
MLFKIMVLRYNDMKNVSLKRYYAGEQLLWLVSNIFLLYINIVKVNAKS